MTALDRQALKSAVGRVLFNNANYPEAVQTRMLGQDTSMLRGLIVNAVLDLVDEEDADLEECDSEIHSWSKYSPNAVDPYWIRCTRLGPHDQHEDSNTGAKWTDAA